MPKGKPTHKIIKIPQKIIDEIKSRQVGNFILYGKTRYGNSDIRVNSVDVKVNYELMMDLNEIINRHNIWGIAHDGISPKSGTVIHRYTKGHSYRRHNDFEIRFPDSYYKLVLLIVTDVSDDLVGGDWIIGENQVITPKRNLGLIMPGYMNHEVTKVKKGYREVFQIRASGKPFV